MESIEEKIKRIKEALSYVVRALNKKGYAWTGCEEVAEMYQKNDGYYVSESFGSWFISVKE